MKHRALIGLGSNLGDGRCNLRAAWRMLSETPGIHPGRLSRPYRTSPVDMDSENVFTNAVGWLETELPAQALLHLLLEVEKKLGRDRTQGKDRTVDLDLLDHHGQVVDEPGLTLPHPGIAQRLFVLAPLAELLPDWRHPLLGKTATRLLDTLNAPDQEATPLDWEKGENHS